MQPPQRLGGRGDTTVPMTQALHMTKSEARILGVRVFLGSPCRRCGSSERYANNGGLMEEAQ